MPCPKVSQQVFDKFVTKGVKELGPLGTALGTPAFGLRQETTDEVVPTRRVCRMDLATVTQTPEPWFERKFRFEFPVEQLPNLCVRLRGTPARLEDTLHSADRDVLVKRVDGKWSAQENAGHLLDLEPLWLARLRDYTSASEQLTVADLSNRKTSRAKHNSKRLEQILVSFRAARMRLLKRVDALDPALFEAPAILHPRLKQPMRLIDHLYFVAEHDDHHLARIWELISA